MKKNIICILLLISNCLLFAASINTNIRLTNSKDFLNDNLCSYDLSIALNSDKALTMLSSQVSSDDLSLSLVSRFNFGKQSETRVSFYNNMMFVEARDMLSLLFFTSFNSYYDISRTYNAGFAFDLSYETRGRIIYGSYLRLGLYAKLSEIFAISDTKILSFAPFFVFDTYVNFYNKAIVTLGINAGEIETLPTTFAFNIISKAAYVFNEYFSLGSSYTLYFSDTFHEQTFVNKREVSIFGNWRYSL